MTFIRIREDAGNRSRPEPHVVSSVGPIRTVTNATNDETFVAPVVGFGVPLPTTVQVPVVERDPLLWDGDQA